jgi:hypothetical protein
VTPALLPPIEEFLETLEGVFGWRGGVEHPQLEPVPALREQLEREWVAPATITRWPGAAPLEAGLADPPTWNAADLRRPARGGALDGASPAES